MNILNYSNFRKHLSKTLDDVQKNHEPIIVTRQNGQSAVVMSLEDFNSYEETHYLLSSPKNAKRLLESAEDVNKNIKLEEHNLLDS